MPRLPRIDFPGARHHVMNRGARHQEIFFNPDSCATFIDLIGSSVERYDIRVHGFVLMPNHYHLMIESVRGNLSDAMKMISSRYVQEMNRQPGWDGPLFRGRFQNKIVYEDNHWRYLLAYLHLNPVKAGLAVSPSQYQWSSHWKYSGELNWPEWLATKYLKSRLGGIGYQNFIERVMNGSMPAPDGFNDVLYDRKRSKRPSILKIDTATPELTKEDALRQVSQLTGVAPKQLLQSRRGREGNAPRALALWWLIYGAGLSNVEVSGLLGISPSGVSKILAQIRDQKGSYQEGRVVEWIRCLREENEK